MHHKIKDPECFGCKLSFSEKEIRFQDACRKLLELLERSVERRVQEGCALAFSGGLDSSILACLASKYTDIKLYAVGLEGSYDIKNAEKNSKLLGLKMKKIFLTKDKVKKLIGPVKEITGENFLHLQIYLPLYALCQRIEEKILLTGQGADELFGGYARYEHMSPVQLKNSLKNDFIGLKKQIPEKDGAICRKHGIELKTPYLDRDVVRLVLSLPVRYKVDNGNRKIILRGVGKLLGLPEEIFNQKKKAMQYGSGVSKVLKTLGR